MKEMENKFLLVLVQNKQGQLKIIFRFSPSPALFFFASITYISLKRKYAKLKKINYFSEKRMRI
jgi:hypothetical protein